MDRDRLRDAVGEAHRFLETVDICLRRLSDDKIDGWPISGLRETGAVRRASLDLSRALAALRRP